MVTQIFLIKYTIYKTAVYYNAFLQNLTFRMRVDYIHFQKWQLPFFENYIS